MHRTITCITLLHCIVLYVIYVLILHSNLRKRFECFLIMGLLLRLAQINHCSINKENFHYYHIC